MFYCGIEECVVDAATGHYKSAWQCYSLPTDVLVSFHLSSFSFLYNTILCYDSDEEYFFETISALLLLLASV